MDLTCTIKLKFRVAGNDSDNRKRYFGLIGQPLLSTPSSLGCVGQYLDILCPLIIGQICQ